MEYVQNGHTGVTSLPVATCNINSLRATRKKHTLSIRVQSDFKRSFILQSIYVDISLIMAR
jgi:hypothetical protein